MVVEVKQAWKARCPSRVAKLAENHVPVMAHHIDGAGLVGAAHKCSIITTTHVSRRRPA